MEGKTWFAKLRARGHREVANQKENTMTVVGYAPVSGIQTGGFCRYSLCHSHGVSPRSGDALRSLTKFFHYLREHV